MINPSIVHTGRRAGAATIFAALAMSAAVVPAAAAPATTEPATTEPSTTEPSVAPIAGEEFTRIDAETPVRGSLPDNVTASVTIAGEGMDDIVIDITDLSHIAVGRYTVQPGAQFPWHTHVGPVLVTVVQGELVYVMAEDCSEHSYPAGSAFVDPGHGHVHTAYNPTDAETVFVATFTEAPADGPLLITEGVAAPDDNCALPTTPPS
ncbi:MAG: cupin domain-containing protein [Actinomycetota bacterium]|nr:cupin domain-containing protein [Actinomycetota bacterium]